MFKRVSIAVGLIATLVWIASYAQNKHGEHTPGMTHGTTSDQQLPLEGGQSAFAALIEIVAMLEADPATQWSEVDISALHLHLQDMNNLILSSSATTQEIDANTIQFTVKGSGSSVGAIHRMSQAHGRFIGQSRGWDIKTELIEDGARVRITASPSVSMDRIRALGFYGYMSLDSHHQAHHLGIAMGGTH